MLLSGTLSTLSSRLILRKFSNNLSVQWAKSASLQRQGKIMNKLFGSRLTGSKKRWYPSQEGSETKTHQVLFKVSQFGQMTRTTGGKNTSRRMAVLNKLFMKHISDLLATGEISEAILGQSLQIQRVKISSDFTGINVYWLGSGQPLQDDKLEAELNRCSGLVRHQLSQLELMGVVPRIKFVHDKTSNWAKVESLLRNMDFGDEEEREQSESHGQESVGIYMEKQSFLGQPLAIKKLTEDISKKVGREDFQLPEMRNDVLGLDHSALTSKILTKMRKSKQAWDEHRQDQQENNDIVKVVNDEMTTKFSIERAQMRLDETIASASKFEEFLASRRERKNTPERKKYKKEEQLVDLDKSGEEWDEGMGLTERQKHLLQQKDFLFEERDDNKSKH